MKEMSAFVVGVHGKFGHGKDWFVDQAQLVAKEKNIERYAFADALKEISSILLDVPIENFYDQKLKELPIPETIEVDEKTMKMRYAKVVSIVTGIDPSLILDLEKNNTFIFSFKMDLESLVLKLLTGLVPYFRYNEKTGICSVKRGTFGLFCQWVGTEIFRKCVHPETWTQIVARKIRESKADLIFVTDVRFENEVDLIESFNGMVIRVEAPEIVRGSRDPNHPSEISLDGIVFHTFVNNRLSEQNKVPNLLFSPDILNMKESEYRDVYGDENNKIICVNYGQVFYKTNRNGFYDMSVKSKICALPFRVSKFNDLEKNL